MFETLILAAAVMIGPVPTDATMAQVQNARAVAAASDIPDKWEPFQECVAKRESHSNYRSFNRSSSAMGKYQFLDNSWRHGGAWNVWKSLIRHGATRAEAKRVRLALMEAPIRKWRGVYQEILFAYVITSREGMGWRHWFLAGSPCNRLART